MLCTHLHPVHPFNTSSFPLIVKHLLSLCHLTPLCYFVLPALELLLILLSTDPSPPSTVVFVASILMSRTKIPTWYLWRDVTPDGSSIFIVCSRSTFFVHLLCVRHCCRLEMQQWHQTGQSPTLRTLSSTGEPGNQQANIRPDGDIMNTVTVGLSSLMSASLSLSVRQFYFSFKSATWFDFPVWGRSRIFQIPRFVSVDPFWGISPDSQPVCCPVLRMIPSKCLSHHPGQASVTLCLNSLSSLLNVPHCFLGFCPCILSFLLTPNSSS